MRNFIILIGLLLVGCEATPKMTTEQSVNFVFSSQDLGHCQLKGEVIGSQGNWISYWFTSDRALAQGMMNDMHNQAVHLGANTVVWRQALNFNLSATAIGQAYVCQSTSAKAQ